MTAAANFADILRIVGRGPTLSRSLDVVEAEAAMTAIMSGAAEPIQVGGFLLVLRARGEAGAELAGFVRAARRRFAVDASGLDVDLDWPSYADRHRQQPWFVLSALLLARVGVKVLIHGVAGAEGSGFAGTRPVLDRLGIAVATDRAALADGLARRNLAYLALEAFSPDTMTLLDLRPLLGVRTAVNSFARALNPADAPAQIQGVFHPPYKPLHLDAARLLGQPRIAVFKGGGGEAQRNPLKPCAVTRQDGTVPAETIWPALLPDLAHDWRADDLSPDRVADLWEGRLDHPAATAMVVGTAALALHLCGRAADATAADAEARALWDGRDRQLGG